MKDLYKKFSKLLNLQGKIQLKNGIKKTKIDKKTIKKI